MNNIILLLIIQEFTKTFVYSGWTTWFTSKSGCSRTCGGPGYLVVNKFRKCNRGGEVCKGPTEYTFSETCDEKIPCPGSKDHINTILLIIGLFGLILFFFIGGLYIFYSYDGTSSCLKTFKKSLSKVSSQKPKKKANMFDEQNSGQDNLAFSFTSEHYKDEWILTEIEKRNKKSKTVSDVPKEPKKSVHKPKVEIQIESSSDDETVKKMYREHINVEDILTDEESNKQKIVQM